ncbi:MAG TPA: hypothetical protein VGZ03_09900 [Acidimicrobiales bacterium]|nr:hypothetical protein [Acidimicrobiales bacterium]
MSRWRVEGGAARRGEAWTDLGGRVMRVPLGGGAHGRLVRAHELMHARVSPITAAAFERWDDLDARSVECAEEFRVNHLLDRLGFEVRELRDGSERLTGERLAAAGEWAELLRFAAAVAGTRGLTDLATGVRRVDPEWARACRALGRDLARVVRRVPTASLASTTPGDDGHPGGFVGHTRAIAELIEARVRRERDGPRGARPHGARPAATGAFAPLLLDDTVCLERRVRGGVRPRRVPAPSGRRVVRAARLVTDPARRAFEQPARTGGGVVVVDQSGSMSITPEELTALVTRAPGALVVGYSHAPGSSGVPNAWILAQGGRSATRIPSGNVGNGVDGPVLRFALSRRRPGEPLIWISDGQVTDSGDHADPDLAAACARLVVRYGIVMVPSVREAIDRLGARRTLRHGGVALGRVAAALSAAR